MSSSGNSGFKYISYGTSLFGTNIGQAILGGTIAVLLSVTNLLTTFFDALRQFFFDPIVAVGEGGVTVATSLFNGFAQIIGVSATASAQALTAQGGPLGGTFFSFIVGLGVVLLSAFGVARFLREQETSDLIPGVFTDFPVVGVTEEDEEGAE